MYLIYMSFSLVVITDTFNVDAKLFNLDSPSIRLKLANIMFVCLTIF